MGIKHIYTQTVADGTATSVVRPSDWNSIHAYTLQDAVSLSGNTAGVLANISSGTLILAGGSNITLSQNGNSVTVSGPSLAAYLTTAARSQDSSKYAGTNGAITGGSLTVNTSGVSINLPAYLTTAMLSNAATLSNIKVSAGASSALRSDLTFSNANGISFGLETNGVITGTVRTNYQSAGAYLTTARASTDAVGLATAQTNVVWTVNSAGLSLDAGGYAGTNFAGTNVSATLNSDGLSVSVAPPSAGGANINLSAGTVSEERSNFTIADSNGLSFGLDGSGVVTGTVRTDYQSAGAYLTTAMLSNAVTLSNIKVSAGASSALLSALTFSNSNGLAFGLSAGTVTGSYSQAAQTDQTVGLYASSNTNLTASGTADARSLSFRAVGPLSIGYSAGEVVFSNVGQVAGAYLTTAALSQDSSNYAGTNGAITGGSITVNTDGVSVALPAYLTTARASNDAIGLNTAKSNVTWTVNSSGISLDARGYAGSGFTSAGNNIGLSGTHNSAGLSLSATVAAQTMQSAIQAFGVSDTGQTAGDTGVSTGMDWVLAGSNSITLSQATTAGGPNTIWVQHPAWLTTAGLSQDSSKYAGINGAITGGSITVNTSGVSVNLPAYLTTADLSANSSKYVQAWELTGNTSGTTSSAPGTKLYFSGGNSLTVSGNGNTIVFSVGNYLTTAGLSQDSSKYAATGFTSAGANIGFSGTLNTAGLSLSATVAAQSNQSAIKGLGVSDTGQTAGNTGLSTGIDWVLAGSQSITLSQSTTAGGPNTIWFKHPAWLTTAGLSQDSSKYAGTGFTSAGANVGISGTQNTAGLSLSVTAAAQTNQTVGLYASSNTYLTSSGTVDARSLSFRGDKSITVGISAGEVLFSVGAYITTAMLSNRGSDFVQATAGFNGTNASGTIASNSISVSVAAPIPIATAVKAVGSLGSTGTITRYAPEDHQHAGVAGIGISTSGNTAGTTGSQVGTYWIQGGNSITVSQITSNNGSHTLVISAGNYLTTAMASNRGSDFVQATAAFAGTNANGTIASDGISVSVAAPIPIGTAVKAVGSAGSTGTITRYAPEDHQHAGVAAIGISTSGNTAGTTGSQVGTYWIQGGNSITVSQITSNNGSHTLVISAGNYLTTAALSQDSSKYAATGFTSAGANVGISGTHNTAGLSLSVTAAAQTNQTIGGYAVGNTTGQSSSSTFDARTVSFNGAGNVSVGYSGGSIVISGASAAPSPVNFSAGTTSSDIGSVVFSNSNGISFGLSGSTITASANTVGTATTVKSVASANSVGTVTRWAAEDHAHAGIGAIGISTGNTTGTSGSVQGSYWLAGSNLASVSQITSNNGSHTLVINASLPAVSMYGPEWNFSGKATNSSLGNSTVYFEPFDLPYYLSASRINFYLSLSGAMSAGNSTGTCSAGIGYGIYTLATGANSQTLSLLTSYSLQLYSISFTSNTVFAATHYAGLSNATSHTTVQTIISNANATTYQATNLNGPRVVAMPLGITMTPGRYYLGVSVQTVSGNALTNNLSVMQTSVGVQPAVYPLGSASAASNASVFGVQQGWGSYSAQTAAFPATIPFTTDAIRRAAAQTLVPFEILGYSTSTNVI